MNFKEVHLCIFCGAETEDFECVADLNEILSLSEEEMEEIKI
jgi:hypothetical protein